KHYIARQHKGPNNHQTDLRDCHD
ncbi:unnamed protein product, partial [Rotaria sp. Silwood1]